MPPGAPSHLERGRAAFERRAWADAHEALGAAAAELALEASDAEKFAWTCGYLALDAEFIAGLERAQRLYAEAGNWERSAWCAFWAGNRLVNLGEVGRGSALLARAGQVIERIDSPTPLEGYLLIPVVLRQLAALELDAAEAAARRALEIASRFFDSNLEALAESTLGRVLLRRGDVERGLEAFDLSVLAVSGEAALPHVAGIVICAAIANCSRVFALDRAREWTGALTRFCENQPQLVTFSSTCLIHCSEVHQASGEWEEALREAELAEARLPKPAVVHHPHGPALYQQAELKRARGDFAEAEELYRAASDKGCEPQPGLALLRLAQGKRDVAAVAIRRVLAATSDPQARLRLLPASVEVLIADGKHEEAGSLVEELERAADELGTDALRAMAAHARGSLRLSDGDAEGALSPLRSSFEIWQRLGAPYLAARVRAELSGACRALGDEDGAELERRGALVVFERVGARHDCAKLEVAPEKAQAGGLSARELTVLRLVAEGKTNKVIAAELGLSEKTVDRHVSNIFDKLDVSSRAAATAYAFKHGLT